MNKAQIRKHIRELVVEGKIPRENLVLKAKWVEKDIVDSLEENFQEKLKTEPKAIILLQVKTYPFN